VSRKGWILFAAMCLLWGIPYLFIKVAVEEVSVPVVVFARTAIGAVLLLPLALRSGQLGVLRRHWRPLVAFAALEIIVPWGLLSAAEQKLPSSLAGLLIAAVPIISVVTARLTGGSERLSRRRWAGLLTGLAGVALLAAPDLGGGNGLAVAEVLLVAFCYATAPLIAARKLADVPALPMTAACLSLGALVWLPAAVVTWPDRVPSGRVLGSLAALGIICTACAFLVFFALIREAGTSRAMVFTYVNPAVAVAAGVLFLSEPFTVTIAVSFGLILAGSLLATWTARDPAEPVGSPGLDRRTGRRAGGVDVFVADRADDREHRDVGDVVVQLDHVGERRSRRGQRPVEVGEDLPGLRLGIARTDQLALVVEGHLSGGRDPAAATGHRVAVARAGRQPVRGPEMLKCRHVPILSVCASLSPGPRLAAAVRGNDVISRITAS
jgi:drug/metabolite transporter (DMT)-like permease